MPTAATEKKDGSEDAVGKDMIIFLRLKDKALSPGPMVTTLDRHAYRKKIVTIKALSGVRALPTAQI